jgi:phosphate transport system substrate-binding protein
MLKYRLAAVTGVCALAAVGLAGSATAAKVPTVQTLPTDDTVLSDTYALLSGTLNPNGYNVVYRFEWGTTTAYGNVTPVTPAGNGKADVPVDVSLDDLKPNTTYHYRLVVSPVKSSGDYAYLGDFDGADATFKTFPGLGVKLVGHPARRGRVLRVKLRAVGPPDETAEGKLTVKGPGKLGSAAFSIDVGKKNTLDVHLSRKAPKKLKLVIKLKGVKKPLTLKATAAAKQTIIGSGSSVAEPYLRALFAGYHKVKPSVHFIYTADGGNAGVKDVQQGRSQFAVNTRPPLPSDSGTTYRQLFLDGLCIDVNAANSLGNLSLTQLADIFLGNVTSWSQVQGSSLTSTIAPVGRDSTAGTYTFFQSAVLGGKTQSTNVNPVTSDGLVATAVANDPNGIGYVGFAHSKGAHLKTLLLNTVPCAPRYVKDQSYPLSRYIWFVSGSSNADPAVLAFAKWVRVSRAAGKIIAKAGAVPAFNKK